MFTLKKTRFIIQLVVLILPIISISIMLFEIRTLTIRIPVRLRPIICDALVLLQLFE